MFCPKCGKEILNNDNFCSGCGNPVKVNSPVVTEQVKVEAEKVQTNTKLKNTIELIVGTAILLGMGYLFVVGGDKIVERYFPSKHEASEYTDWSLIELTDMLTDISFNNYGYLSLEFENLFDKDIAYIEFETYFYDTMGKFTGKDSFEYTGPLYSGGQDSLEYYTSSIDRNTGVVYPKNITITFTDDKSITIQNALYAYSEKFYGGSLKDEE